jgi:oligopeptide transport system ATP-binding protein
MENDKKVLLSLKDLEVKFHVRGRILTAIRGVSLDIYENESLAIVGESGSGKSVLTKTFSGMLDSNGFISKGELQLYDDELQDTVVKKTKISNFIIDNVQKSLNKYSKYEFGADIYKEMLELKAERERKISLTDEEKATIDDKISDLKYEKTELFNLKQTYDPKNETDKIAEAKKRLAEYDKQIKELENKEKMIIKEHKAALKADVEYNQKYNEKMASLKQKYEEAITHEITNETISRNFKLSKELYLSIGRYGLISKIKFTFRLKRALKNAMKLGVDLYTDESVNKVFDTVVFRVAYLDEDDEKIHGYCNLDLAKIKYTKDWQQIRGTRVATIFQDPMTSLNPIITIGKQITSIIMKHQSCSANEARIRAIELMKKVGIPNAEKRFDDYPFQYSGGMRQRIVIAIALSCQPKILVCDEPTTALDVTIQAQILKLIKDLQKEFNYTIVFITHDLGVVANIADRVAVIYAGQIVELGTCEEVFYDPRHPYTWALLSSLPQLAERGTELYSISGTPPSLYNKIVGDPFAPRNPYCLKIDTLKDSPMFKVTDTHYAKTWLLDPRSPKIEKPEIIQDIHNKLIKVFNI